MTAADRPAENVGDSAAFTTAERQWVRDQLHVFFGTAPKVADGFILRRWRGGPEAGGVKVPPAVRTLLARGLVVIRGDDRFPRAHLTHEGLVALRDMARSPRGLDPERFGHVREELGLD